MKTDEQMQDERIEFIKEQINAILKACTRYATGPADGSARTLAAHIKRAIEGVSDECKG